MVTRTTHKGPNNLYSWIDSHLYPVLWEKLDQAFPEFGWKMNGDEKWVATRWPDNLDHGSSPRPARLVCGKRAPWGFHVHGRRTITWIEWLGGRGTRGEAFRKVVNELCRRAGISPPSASPEEAKKAAEEAERQRILERVVALCQRKLWQDGENARKYLEKRGIPEAEIQQQGWGLYDLAFLKANNVRPRMGLLHPKMDGYLVLPWRDVYGRVLTLYGRWPGSPPQGRPKTMGLPGEGTKRHPLGLDLTHKMGFSDLTLVEGLLDWAVLRAFGVQNVIACCGAGISMAQAQTLAGMKVRSVRICLDPDGAGDEGTIVTAKRLRQVGVAPYVVERLPEGMDPDEFVLEHGVEAWRDRVSRAISAGRWQVIRLLSSLPSPVPDADRQRLLDRAREELEGALTLERKDAIEVLARALRLGRRVVEKTVFGGPKKESKEKANRDLTDMGNANRFVERHGDEVRYSPEAGWWVWTGTRWQRCKEDGLVQAKAKEIVDQLLSEALESGDENLLSHAMRSRNVSRVRAILQLATDRLLVEPTLFDRPSHLLNTPAGVVNLRTGEIGPHRREDYLSHETAVPPAARPSDVWLQFLEDVMPDAEVRSFLQRAVGYSLTGEVCEEVFFLLHGEGNNGKTTFLEAIKAAVGSYGSTVAPNLLVQKRGAALDQHPTAIADLKGTRFAYTEEVDDGTRFAEAVVKQLTGGGTLKARYMRRDFFEFEPTHKLWFAVNHKPRVTSSSVAIWRRILLVPFTVQIPPEKKDKTLKDRLQGSERAGILRWMIDGAVMWYREGLNPPPAVRAAIEKYRTEENQVERFLDERTEEADGYSVPKDELYRAYRSWCEDNGERPRAKRKFGDELRRLGYSESKGSRGRRFWLGLTLTDEED